MSFSSSSWQSAPTQANKLRTSYLKGFLDISGTDAAGLRVRNNNAIELFNSSDAPKFQMNATEYTVPDAGNAALSITVPIEKLSYLYGLNTNIQGKFDAISNGESVSNNLATVNANVSGNLEIGNQLIVGGEAEFRRNVIIGGNLNVAGNVIIDGNEYVNKSLFVKGDATIDGRLYVLGDVSMSDDLYVKKKLHVGQDSVFDSNLLVSGKLTVTELIIGNNVDDASASGFQINQKITATAGLDLTGSADFHNALNVDGKITGTGGLDITGATTMSSTLVASGKITGSSGLAITGTTDLSNALNVTGATTLSSTLGVTGKITGAAALELTGAATMHSTLGVDGKITGSAALELTGAATMHSTLGVDGKITGSDELAVAKAATFSDVMSVAKKATFSDKMSVAMDASFGADLQIANKLRVGNDSASVYINGPNYIGSAFANSISVKAGDLDIAPGSANNSVHIRGGLYVDGSVNFLGDFIKTDTKVQVTDQIEVTNSGTGPALKITQTGANPVASFSDSNGIAFLMDDAGKMGIGAVGGSWNVVSNKPTAELDVHGAAKISTTLDVTGAASLADTLAVTGASTFTGVATFQNGIVLGQTFVDQW
jgi:cytoskeletal protein CcmA (bactofilin family)